VITVFERVSDSGGVIASDAVRRLRAVGLDDEAAPQAGAASGRLRRVVYPGAASPVESSRRTLLIRLVSVAALVVSVGYLVWRAAATLNLPVWWVALPLFAVEAHAFLSFGLFVFSLWDVAPPAAPTAMPDLRVAVLIPTYDEELAVLLPTVAAALALAPDHETWVLDDGRRTEVEQMCRTLGAQYVTRANNEGAKAGNLNNALALLDCDLIAVLDADHVVQPGFLERTLPFFSDPTVALVQTPQDFYNLDSFEHPGDTANGDPHTRQHYHEQALFYRAIQPGKNRWNAAFWCGTNAVVRLQALRSIGGIATETITEDIHTSVRFHRAGWRTVYLNEVLARGLAAKTVSAYTLQRRRWGVGAMQLLRRENPLSARGLSLPQRLAYATTLLGWFDAWRTLAYLILPPLVLFSGASPIRAHAAIFAASFIGSLLLQQTALVLLGRGYHRPVAGALYDLARMPANISATLQLLRARPQRFRVTPKGRTSNSRTREARLLIAVLVLSVTALAWYAATLLGATPTRYAIPWVAHGAAFWLCLNALLVLLTLRRTTARTYAAELRSAFRFPSDAIASFGGLNCTITDLSMTGARLRLPTIALSTTESGTLRIRHGGTLLELAATVITRSTREAVIGVEFDPTQYTQLATLACLLFPDTAAGAGALGEGRQAA
jgi:cellulose synthase/poly-beta-1,6-N-acetylglucosamine synthase-like glycosyltransferase